MKGVHEQDMVLKMQRKPGQSKGVPCHAKEDGCVVSSVHLFAMKSSSS